MWSITLPTAFPRCRAMPSIRRASRICRMRRVASPLPPAIRWMPMPATSTSCRARGGSIRWLGESRKSSGSRRFSRAGARTIPCWWARRALARRRLPKAWPSASSMARFPTCWRTAWSIPWTSAPCWRAPSIAATSRSASRRCSTSCASARMRCCSSTRSIPSSAPVRRPAG
ncbi:hypothetical protein D9M71_671920 [compost metagenome]